MAESFALAKWLGPLYQELLKRNAERAQELAAIGDVFGDPKLLANFYIQPSCQHHNPADRHEDLEPMAQVRQPAFEVIDAFLKGNFPPLGDGRTQLFILSDAGMGKTSLLMMIRLMHLTAFWPKGYDCRLLKLGPDTLEKIRSHSNQAGTVLLLDALDEDPTAWSRIEGRLLEILDGTKNYRRVILSCRTQFFPETAADSFGRPGRVQVGGYTCPMVFLSLFDDDQVDAYLRRRFPASIGQGLMARDNPVRERAAAVVLSMQSLRFRPLLLAHIQDIMDAGEREWDSYSLYEALVDRWLAREEVKLRRQLKDAPNKAILWRICAAVATQMQASGHRLLSRVELDALLDRFPAVAALEHFDVGGRSLMNRNAEGAYRFSHYSIQEFLVVHDLLQKQARASDRSIRQPVRVTAEMVGFLRCTGAIPSLSRLDLLDLLDLSGLERKDLAEFDFCDRLADGAEGPLMNLIPNSSFLKIAADSVSSATGSERPQHEFQIVRSFGLRRFPVTFDEYDLFCDSTHRGKPGDEGWGRGSRPVINVSWDDAVAYCAWLSRQTGQGYRLPTEAEWEHACRAGTKTLWSFGDDASALGEYAWFNGNSNARTQPVGQKCPNRWGIYDLHGNVWEWVQDCWCLGSSGMSVDEVARVAGNGGDGARRVVRGGSWGFDPWWLRSANRNRYARGDTYNALGFRLARTL